MKLPGPLPAFESLPVMVAGDPPALNTQPLLVPTGWSSFISTLLLEKLGEGLALSFAAQARVGQRWSQIKKKVPPAKLTSSGAHKQGA